MINKLEYVDLFNGLNQSPIPLEISQAMTTQKQLYAMQASINNVVTNVNNAIDQLTQYSDTINDNIMILLNGSATLDAKFLKNQSVTLDKVTTDVISTLHDRIMSYIGDIMKFVTFEINDNGYFIANVPETWGGFTFSSDSDGHLILNVKY